MQEMNPDTVLEQAAPAADPEPQAVRPAEDTSIPSAPEAPAAEADAPQPEAPEEPAPVTVVDIRFRNNAKSYFFDPNGLTLAVGDHVIIDTARGDEFGICAAGNHAVRPRELVLPLRKVLRAATAQDERINADNQEKEKRAFEVCQQKIADHKLEIQTTPADAQYIGVVMGTSGQAPGYVTLVLSEKIRTLLKLIPLPKKMSATPDQTEEFNVYSYLKQLIDGNDVSVLLRVGDEAVSVLNIINFYLPSAYVKTIQNVSNGLKLALDLIRKYLPESAFTRIYLDEQPVDAGGYVAGAVALESGDINSAGVAMFKIKPQTSNVRLYWAGDLPGSLTAEELRNADRNAVLEADGQARSGEGVNISYTYKKKGFLWDKTCDGLPTKPGTYTQVAKVSGNYSCSEISRTFTIYQ